MSSIWDLNFRISYDLQKHFRSTVKPKLIVDVFHLGSERQPVNFDQVHFLALDEIGNQIGENPNYLKPLLYQPPMAVRLGLEVEF